MNTASEQRPNVLFFCVDEMRADYLACMGNPVVKTPNLDRLAAGGTLFRRAYCNNPICMPARATMFTGLPPVYRQVLSGDLKPNGVDNRGVTEAHWREIIAGTYGMITHLDMEVGRVLDALEESGQAENTIVVFTSDHGDMMGDHGLLWKSFYTFRGCVQIPLIIAVPHGVKGQVSETPACQLDYLPTLLDLAGIPMPGDGWAECSTPFERGSVQPLHSYPGFNLAALLRGEAVASGRDDVVVENDDPTTGFRVRALITDRYRLTVYPGMDYGELFDLQKDPDELWNLWARPDCRELRQSLTGRLLERYAQETPLFPIPPWNS